MIHNFILKLEATTVGAHFFYWAPIEKNEPQRSCKLNLCYYKDENKIKFFPDKPGL